MQVGDRSTREVAEEFGISADSVRRWMQQAERDQGSRQDGLRSAEREELVRLRRENRRLKMEREILSKSSHLVRSGDRFDPVRVFGFVRAHQGQYPIACMCRVLGVSIRRVLRMAAADAEPAGARARGVEPADRGDPRGIAADLRGAAGARGAEGGGRERVAAAGGAADAGAGAGGRDAEEAALHDAQGAGSGRGAGPGPAAFRGVRAEPAVGG